MEYQKFRAITALCFMTFSIVFAATMYLQQAQATGDGIEIAELIQPMVQRAMDALNQGDTEKALEELETINNELEDTFSIEE